MSVVDEGVADGVVALECKSNVGTLNNGVSLCAAAAAVVVEVDVSAVDDFDSTVVVFDVGGGATVRLGAGRSDANKERFSFDAGVAPSPDAAVERGASSFASSLSAFNFSASSRSFSRMASVSIDLNDTGPLAFDDAFAESAARKREPIMPAAGTFSGCTDPEEGALWPAGGPACCLCDTDAQEFIMTIFTKRIYAPAAVNDGWRVLVDRLWPRGVRREETALDHWLKAAAAADLSASRERRPPVEAPR